MQAGGRLFKEGSVIPGSIKDRGSSQPNSTPLKETLSRMLFWEE